MVWFWVFGVIAAYGSMPLQSSAVVIGIGSIMFVFSLSLFGVYEIVLPGAAAGRLDAAASREGYTGAFLKGLLATLLGTACTAPFLGFALGYALTQPRWVGVAIFTAAGVGMASPYLLLSAKPGWLRFVPKPGPWMVTFKQAMGFVLLATAVWLLWVLGRQVGADGVVWTVAFWGFLGVACWMLGKITPIWSTTKRVVMWSLSLAIAAFGLYFSYFVMFE
jgi:thiol:disulfide interchange protein DsbD